MRMTDRIGPGSGCRFHDSWKYGGRELSLLTWTQKVQDRETIVVSPT